MRAGASTTAIRAGVIATAMRAGAIGTAVVAGYGVLAAFRHESPPTIGHMVAGVAIGVPTAILVVAAFTLPVSSRSAARLLLLQLIATGVILGVLFSQRSHPPLWAWFAMILFLGAPIVATALFTRALPRMAAAASAATPNAGYSTRG